MQPSSPLVPYPSTPKSSLSRNKRFPLMFTNRPINSSPLASPTDLKSSPVSATQSRRQSQYKSRTPSTPIASSSRSPAFARPASGRAADLFGSNGAKGLGGNSVDGSQKAFLREKFRARCVERAAKARAKAVKGKRYAGGVSSDGFDEAMEDEEEEEEDDDAIMQDELFRRIIEHTNRTDRHAYRVSYAQEVGSSFDPDMEDVGTWERDLEAAIEPFKDGTHSTMDDILTPVDIDEEELAEYAEEYIRVAALADFEDIPPEELFDWDGLGDVMVSSPRADEDMDVS